MHYSDIVLYQGADPDGIQDAMARLLGVLHGINRAHGAHGDQHRQKGEYPLAAAFPHWQNPLFSAQKRLSNGCTGPILRVFGPEPLLNMLCGHKLLQSLELEGRAQAGAVHHIPENISRWVRFSRYHNKEKEVSGSYGRRLERRRALLGVKHQPPPCEPVENPLSCNDLEISKFKPSPFVFIGILRKDKPPFSLPVRRTLFSANEKPDHALRINSWGLVTEGALPDFLPEPDLTGHRAPASDEK